MAKVVIISSLEAKIAPYVNFAREQGWDVEVLPSIAHWFAFKSRTGLVDKEAIDAVAVFENTWPVHPDRPEYADNEAYAKSFYQIYSRTSDAALCNEAQRFFADSRKRQPAILFMIDRSNHLNRSWAAQERPLLEAAGAIEIGLEKEVTVSDESNFYLVIDQAQRNRKLGVTRIEDLMATR